MRVDLYVSFNCLPLGDRAVRRKAERRAGVWLPAEFFNPHEFADRVQTLENWEG